MSKIKKKALILGVTGQDGSLMARLLIKKKYIVHGLIRKSATGNLKNISDLVRDKKSFIVEHGDLLDVISMTNIISKIKPDEIYNFADQDHVRWSFELPSYSFAVTGSAVLNLLEIIKKYSNKSKYFQPLSSNMFAQSKNTKQNENEPFTPVSVYGVGKVTAFYICKLYRDIFNLKIYGAFFYNHESELRPEEYVTRKITKAVARIFYGKQKILKLGDVNAKIDWGYARDYVESSYKIMQQKKSDFFIIASGKKYSVLDFVKKSFNYVGLDYKKHLRIDKKLLRPSRTVSLIGDISKAKKTFKYKPKTNIDQLISIMMENDLNIEKNIF
tara:strand:+ start:764 stop:1750 length:987 start_codon:yes stop_codon:yes gene_type:complete